MSGRYHPLPDASSPFRERLLHPRWAAIEAALGRPLPGVLRELLDHQTGEPGREPVAPSLAEFVRWPRQYHH